jgi:two-component system, chemotaxis family, chemotaxis protein CheY
MTTPLSVLIVDDHEGMRTLLRAILERGGMVNVRESSDGAAGLAAIAEAAPQLILVDQRMPGMDGMAFIAHVRADERCNDTRIVMISGEVNAATRDAARAAGADAVLSKPVSPRDLMSAIEALFA